MRGTKKSHSCPQAESDKPYKQMHMVLCWGGGGGDEQGRLLEEVTRELKDSRGNSMCKDPVEGRHGECEAWRASDGVTVEDGEVKAGDTGGSWTCKTWWAGFRDLASPRVPSAGSSGRGTSAFPPRALFTSSVLASIFLWVRASRRTDEWTPRS